MELRTLVDNSNMGEITAFIGEFKFDNDLTYLIENQKVGEFLFNNNDQNKVLKALQLVGLSRDILEVSYHDLSLGEKNLLQIVQGLLSKEENLILINVHKGLNYRLIENLKRVLKKITEYNKRVIVITNDIEFLFNLTKKVIAIKNNKIIKKFYPVNWFDDEIYSYVPKSEIIKFTEYSRKQNIKIENALETKELLKAIYRSVDK